MTVRRYKKWISFAVAVTMFGGAVSVHASGNPDAGEAQAAACGACHGQDGASPIDPSYPHLAGQNERYC